ncbi:MAG: Na(+)/H(+) antiporter subunit B [bacterium]|nr:Na(+)/H(+) antiporter subunit B [bacterium]
MPPRHDAPDRHHPADAAGGHRRADRAHARPVPGGDAGRNLQLHRRRLDAAARRAGRRVHRGGGRRRHLDRADARRAVADDAARESPRLAAPVAGDPRRRGHRGRTDPGHAGHAGLRRPAGPGPHPRRAGVPARIEEGHGDRQHRHDRPGQLSRLRHAGRGVRDLHRRRRRAGAAATLAARRGGRVVKGHRVLRIVAKLLIPYILVFALYVQFHGDYGPGGGFQAGVIFAAGYILFSLVFGLEPARGAARPGVLERLFAAGVLLYAGVGVATMLLGGDFLEYNVLEHDPKAAQHLGVLLVELGVGLTVATVMISIFFAFAGRGKRA